MKRITLNVVGIAAVLWACCAVSVRGASEGAVVHLTGADYDAAVAAHRLTLVLVTAPWCAQCAELARVHAAAAAQVAEDGDAGVAFATLDASTDAPRVAALGAPTVPALVLVARDGPTTEYTGAPTPAALAAYVRARAGTVVAALRTPAALAHFLARPADARFVAYTAPESALARAFTAAATACHDGAFLFAIAEPEAATTGPEAKDTVTDTVVAYRDYPGEAREVRFTDTEKAEKDETEEALTEALGAWFWDAGTPLAGVLDAETQGRYQTRPTLVVFARVDPVHDAAGTRYLLNRLRAVARDYAGRVRFAAQDRATSDVYDRLGVPLAQPYAVAVHAGAHWHASPASAAMATLQPGALRAVADAFLAGTLPRHVVSEDAPDALRARAVHAVVASTFDALVHDTATDTLLAVISPACPHCRALAPAWDALAARHNVPGSTVRIARIDATRNELPDAYRVPGFPTIFWVPAHRGAQPVRYDGPRDADSLERYIARHASRDSSTFPLDAPLPRPLPRLFILAVAAALIGFLGGTLVFCFTKNKTAAKTTEKKTTTTKTTTKKATKAKKTQ